ncbi:MULTISPECIES: ComEA family DNA-binding protein [unclassified Paraflavitalea]|uniref:ComEA family DNA-binding protein n=1 Tax=unclassified Paraflavitalea TaxID=2798305 RepID=UPI003D34DBC0
MRKLMLLGLLLFNGLAYAQVENEQAIEELKERDQEPDDYWLDTKLYPKIKLNTVDPQTLELFDFLTPFQRLQFFNYRKTLGAFLSIWELQAVPGWDKASFDKMRPFVKAALGGLDLLEDEGFFTKKRTVVLQRLGLTISGLGAANGKKSLFIGPKPLRSLTRVDFSLSKKIEAGLTLEKDAGEPWWSGSGPIRGVDFMSFRIRLRPIGRLKSLYIGDYTLNIGQGLTIWQSMAFGKSSAIGSIKREGEVVRVYKGSGEYNFMRGIAAQFGGKRAELNLFASLRNLDANSRFDSVTGIRSISSFISSGFHGSAATLQDARQVRMWVLGAVMGWKFPKGRVGVHILQYKWSKPIQKQAELYNLFAVSGRQLFQAGLSYSYVFRNLQIFGEWVRSQRKGAALVFGGLLSVDAKTDLSFLYRKINPEYQSFWSNAFVEATQASNERGLFLGLEHRMSKKWRLVSFVDSYEFDWVKYRMGRSTAGTEAALSIFYTPNRKLSIQVQARLRRKDAPVTGNEAILGKTVEVVRNQFKYQFDYQIDSVWKTRVRFDWVGLGGANSGFVVGTDLIYRPLGKYWDLGVRWSLSKVGNYASRVYVTERDVLYAYSVYVFDQNINRIAINYHIRKIGGFERKKGRENQVWIKFAQTVVSKNSSYVGELINNREILGTELKIQWLQIL